MFWFAKFSWLKPVPSTLGIFLFSAYVQGNVCYPNSNFVKLAAPTGSLNEHNISCVALLNTRDHPQSLTQKNFNLPLLKNQSQQYVLWSTSLWSKCHTICTVLGDSSLWQCTQKICSSQSQCETNPKWISGNGLLYITGCFFERISRWLGKRERGNAQVVQSGYCIGPTITARLALSQRGQIPWCHFHLRDCNWCCPLSIRPLSLSPPPTQTGTTSCQAKYGFVWRRNASGGGCSSLQLPDTSRVAQGHCSQEVI